MENKIECLITTFNYSKQEIFNMLCKMNLFCSAIVRNQTDNESFEQLVISSKVVKIFNCTDRGLSKNRNEIIKLSKAKYVLFCDDDIIFDPDCEKIINNEVEIFEEKFGRLDGVLFNIKSLNPDRPVVLHKAQFKKCRFKHVRNSGIWRLLLKREVASSILFDEDIGSGTKYLCGEDTLFLHQLLKIEKKTIYISDKNIGSIIHSNSLWFDKRHSDEYLLVKGHVYKTIYPLLYRVYIIRFLYLEGLLNAKNYKTCIIGAKQWRTILKEK